MTNYKPLRLSSSAKTDLKRIAAYTLQEWGVVQKKVYLDLIKKSFNTLSTVGNIGKKRDDIEHNLYAYCIKKHTVYFRETDHEFVVIRILHSRMDPQRHLT
ncbi:MAG: type II toxin-antitoxin system RelE/ParE family toxin [Methylococcaceae bacterium]|nr:type II toxin-antitoxin system RelE/ParE family toxin [Methylococcaceae bacterium]